MSTQETPLFIQGSTGLLEALLLDSPMSKGIALICHPNPLQAGTMYNKVVSTLQRVARDVNLNTLRFNYRGVGKSAGEHDPDGYGEVDDAMSAIVWIQQHYPALPITLMGFSFGGFVALSLANQLQKQGIYIQQLIAVAPAIQRITSQSVSEQSYPLTIIQPEEDEVLAPEQIYLWSQQLERAHNLIKVPQCSHFFHAKLTHLKTLITPLL